MSDIESESGLENVKRPWHMWVVGVLTLFWNGSGAVTFLMAQLGLLPNLSPEEAAFYAAQPLWYVLLVNIATWGAFLAGIALLFKSRIAFNLFGLSLVMIVVTDLIDLATSHFQTPAQEDATTLTLMVLVIAVLQFLYTWRWKLQGVLK